MEALRSCCFRTNGCGHYRTDSRKRGIIEVPVEFFARALAELSKKHNFLSRIADEIQSGIGRTGKFFGYEHLGMKPDIIVCAKAIGGGLPLGAILSRKEIAEAFKPGTHGTTFGGNVLACVAGSVVLDLIEQSYMSNAASEGAYIVNKFCEALQAKHPNSIREVRGRGAYARHRIHSPNAKQVQESSHSTIISSRT